MFRLKSVIFIFVTNWLLVGLALIVGQFLETTAVITAQRENSTEQYRFYLRNIYRDVHIDLSAHTCIVNQTLSDGLSRWSLDRGEWAANVTFATHNRMIFMIDVITGIPCNLSIR